ncbi:MAG: cobaltochelatase subunit CobN [Rhodospirillaceae bacterium]|nr:cobaltochelatase subunit CobN [Rhodospirillaceae bacterium]
MHLLASTSGIISDQNDAIDLCQSPGDIVILSAADSDLACLSAAFQRLKMGKHSLRLANLLQLNHNLSVDLYIEKTLCYARLIIIRLIGGRNYWLYGLSEIEAVAKKFDIRLVVIPGDDKPDLELTSYSTVSPEITERCWMYFTHGGIDNALNLLIYANSILGDKKPWKEPAPLLKAGFYWPSIDLPSFFNIEKCWTPERSVILITFYRALMLSGNLEPINSVINMVRELGFNALPIYVSSLKDNFSSSLIKSIPSTQRIRAILNFTSFASSKLGSVGKIAPFEDIDCPVFQLILSGSSHEEWETSDAGLSSRDIAMNVALPEVDGRLISRAVSFKKSTHFDPSTECAIVIHNADLNRVRFVCELVKNWVILSELPENQKRIAIILSNYPNKDSRVGNGVGLDTPASLINIILELKKFGYNLEAVPTSVAPLMSQLIDGPTNQLSGKKARTGHIKLSIKDYRDFFSGLDAAVQEQILERWGDLRNDPFVVGDDFILSLHTFGNLIIGVQPARGYNIDPKATYHDQALVPPHGYMAFYAWLRYSFKAHAVIHLGKHGNLEWLPGKSIALSDGCYPEAALGPTPLIYPFIVNDPGEGTQAKRRTTATIVDHLTPPLTRAETYDKLIHLENLLDEYYQAVNLDPRRTSLLSQKIIENAQSLKIDIDCGIKNADADSQKLQKLDAYLCDLKEMQIRDGLHILGESPKGNSLHDLLVALLRVPRSGNRGEDASLTRAIAEDLGLLEFDPLDCDMSDVWLGQKHQYLLNILPTEIWRSHGDTVERLELLAKAIVSGVLEIDPTWSKTKKVLDFLEAQLRPAVLNSGPNELASVCGALAGKFIAPGPSGAPTRGRSDVLPTGRNFYSVDTRSIPTPTAWRLGWKAAGLVLDKHRQDHGEWPKAIALSAWGTSNMRTGGDDIAQALAFMGVSPEWEPVSGRLTSFNIIPLTVLDRPRVDVTFRVSGFFRDAFPYQLELLDSAIRAVAILDEPKEENPLAWTVGNDVNELKNNDIDEETALSRAATRVFGSKPGTYGAGMQALIDEGIWDSDDDFAETYVKWGGFAYGTGVYGEQEQELFRSRLKRIQVVLHNQDNREHDILDSDDYYQFQGGLSAAVRHFSGAQPVIYHGDNSKPETPKIRTLEDEIGRVVRGRAVNPKWIHGVMRHGYKGGFELAATVDYLFAFAATSRCVKNHHFDAVFEAYIENSEVRDFLEQHNSNALKDIVERLTEAQDRGLWRPSRNSIVDQLAQIRLLN